MPNVPTGLEGELTRASPWLEDSPRSADLIRLREYVLEKWTGVPPPLYHDTRDDMYKYFTIHDHTHSLAVEEYLYELVPDHSGLNESEKLCLLAGAWIHDLGMIPTQEEFERIASNPKKALEIRDEHHMRSARLVESDRDKIFHRLFPNKEERDTLQTMAEFHRGVTDISRCPNEIGRIKKVRLLAAYLRLADALCIDYRRRDEYLHNVLLQLGGVPRESQLYWEILPEIIETVEPKPKDFKINIQVKMPSEWKEDESREKRERLEEIIKQEVEPELERIKNELVRGGMTVYLETEISPLYHGIEQGTKDKLKKFIHEVLIMHYPNASKLIETFLNTVLELAESTEQSGENLVEKIGEYVEGVNEEIRKTRRCHLGLINLCNIFRVLLEGSGSFKEKLKRIAREATAQREGMEKAREKIRGNGKPLFLDSGALLLFGYSDSVICILEDEEIERETPIYVAECRNKTKYRDERMTYHDGIYYAQKIKEIGFKQVNLISEASVSHYLSSGRIKKVVFGANGIDPNQGFVHTVGHLTLADLAREYNVPVYLVASTLKIGRLEGGDDERKEEWLATNNKTYREFMENIRILKPLEDVVPFNKVALLITEKGVSPPTKEILNRWKHK